MKQNRINSQVMYIYISKLLWPVEGPRPLRCFQLIHCMWLLVAWFSKLSCGSTELHMKHYPAPVPLYPGHTTYFVVDNVIISVRGLV